MYTEVDVSARLKDQTLVTIEIQLRPQVYFKERALYYAAEKYRSNYGRIELERLMPKIHGAKYSSLYPVYGINILDFILFKEDRAVLHSFEMYDKEPGLTYAAVKEEPLLNVTFLELKKQPAETQKKWKDWIDYFHTGKVAETAPGSIKEACEIAAYQNLAKEEREMIDAAEKAREDLNAMLAYAENEGMEKGVAQGMEKVEEQGIKQGMEQGNLAGKLETTKKMLAMNASVEFIQEATGLDIAAVHRLEK